MYHQISFQVAQYRAGTYVRKIFGDDQVKDVLKRLDQLTQDEAQAAVAQTSNVVHNLEERTQTFIDLSLTFC